MAKQSYYLWPPYLVTLFLCALISLPKSHSQQSPAYLGFVSNAAEDYYDYIVSGVGTGGCPFRRSRPRTDGMPNARGKVFGGSSTVNAGFYSRADNECYERLLINQSYEWVEKAIVLRPELREWQSSVREGLLVAGVDPYNGNVLVTKIGGSTFDSSGTRHSAADLLSYANLSNIEVVLHASVERILLARGTDAKLSAIGVFFRDEIGHFHHAMVRYNGEALLTAGAIGTPQLLLLSGFGPRAYLASWGIPVTHHSPYVGQFMHDNPRNRISIVPPVLFDHSLIQVVGITDSGTYLESASNIIPFASPSRPVFIRSPGFLTVATLMEKVIGPVLAGSLRLASTDMRANPIVRFNYFSNPGDLGRCINGTRIIGDVLRGCAMDDFKFHQWFGRRDFRYVGSALPVDQSDDVEMGEFCRRTVSTIWQYHGGCVVGKVIDRELKVIGINALRDVHSSIFTVFPGTDSQSHSSDDGEVFLSEADT